ncbi:MAG: hypothetical protein A2Y25_10070 [Candidatus Melainabacteria bacterium GWF2_37_15]|nr:MAG: hypothetical protein A2Y25_10070 [Candidatus Melainabacteria bacterium GWF2_37_15]
MTVTGRIIDKTQQLIARGVVKYIDRKAAKELGKEKLIIPDLRKKPDINDFPKLSDCEPFDVFAITEKVPDKLDKLEKIAPKTARRIRNFIAGIAERAMKIFKEK